MLSLCSMASKAAGLREYIKEKKPEDKALQNTVFQQGDVVNTIIKCSNGESILLTLDTTLPRAYSRGFTVQGTKGMYMEDNASISWMGMRGKDHLNGRSSGEMWSVSGKNMSILCGENISRRG